jgi:hypothetical protein
VSTLSDLKSAQGALGSFWTVGLGGGTGVLIAIDRALAPPSPTGSPGAINGQADAYAKAASQVAHVAEDLKAVAAGSLPAAWKGPVAETAAQAVTALSNEVGTAESTLTKAATALREWADALKSAQDGDAQGVALLKKAKDAIGPLGLDVFALKSALQQANEGVAGRVTAAQLAQDTGTRTASTLNQLAGQARAERAAGGPTDALSAVVLATESNPGGDADAGTILSANALSRANSRLSGLSAADQAKFQQLLADSKSPEESAYLWKALAAGHSVADVEQFDSAIHGHGDDPTWLAEHLTPTMTNAATGKEGKDANFLSYKGDQGAYTDVQGWGVYDQGNVNDCVAASTVVAQANVDPTVMLKLTTGGTADGDDSIQAFHDRLQKMYDAQYVQGQQADGDRNTYPKEDGGLGSKGEDLLANQDLDGTTGSKYHYVGLNSTEDRQNAVSQIEQSVDVGKPVPLDIRSDKNAGHQVMVIGHDGDRLEVYNPWGYTVWVSESQFVNNDLGSITTTAGGGEYTTADGLELPQ